MGSCNIAFNGVWVSISGVRVFIEPKALFHVVGTTMDFQVLSLLARSDLIRLTHLLSDHADLVGICI